MLCWLMGLPKLLGHFLLTLPALILYLFYKLTANQTAAAKHLNLTSPQATPSAVQSRQQQQLQKQNFDQFQRQLTGQLRDKMRSMMTRALNRPSGRPTGGYAAMEGQRGTDMKVYYLASLLLVGLLCASHLPLESHGLEQVSIDSRSRSMAARLRARLPV